MTEQILLGFEMTPEAFEEMLAAAREAVTEEVEIQRKGLAEGASLPDVISESVMANSRVFTEAVLISPEAGLMGNFIQLAVAHTMLREALDALAKTADN